MQPSLNWRRFTRSIVQHLKIKQQVENSIRWSAKAFHIDLLRLAYRENGILNYGNSVESGEQFLLSQWLPTFLHNFKIVKPCLIDIGANRGDYTVRLAKLFPSADIYSFEPNPFPFSQLQRQTADMDSVKALNIGFGSSAGKLNLAIRQDNASSSHATVYSKVLTEVHRYSDLDSIEICVTTLDDFCREQKISTIHFMKVDTEGHEYSILQGAQHAIKEGVIKCLQFEFNEMNVFSRVFMRDFFNILEYYNIYRLMPHRLLPLQYDPMHEIFKFQNLLAVRKDSDLISS